MVGDCPFAVKHLPLAHGLWNSRKCMVRGEHLSIWAKSNSD